MASSITAIKEQAVSYQPLLLATITFPGGTVLRLSTHNLTGAAVYRGDAYQARILNQQIAAVQALSEQGIDITPSVTLELADADKFLWTNYERSIGFKGATLALVFAFFDVDTNTFSSDEITAFVGTCDPPQIDDLTLSVTANSRMNLSRYALPTMPISRRCVWSFPGAAAQQADADNEDSPFFECGYGAGGIGTPGFTTCGYTKDDCKARGLYDSPPGRFGGIQWEPVQELTGRTFFGRAQVKFIKDDVADVQARYGDTVPLIYGTTWIQPPVLNTVGDGNLTKVEVLLTYGELEDLAPPNHAIQKVVVNGVEIQHGTNDAIFVNTPPRDKFDPAYGYWLGVNRGLRNGAPNADKLYDKVGDPYGSMAVLTITVPRRLSEANAAPNVSVLVRGPKVRVYTGPSVNDFTSTYTENPAWIILDMLVWAGWRYGDIDLASFVTAAAVCAAAVPFTNLNGRAATHPRYSASLALRQRQNAADLVKGMRNSCKAILRPNAGDGGKLQLLIRDKIARQQPSPISGSNYGGTVNGGYVAYKFDESNILVEGEEDRVVSSLRIRQRAISDSPNRMQVTFQDRENNFAADVLNQVDTDDVNRSGQEVTVSVPLEGINSFDQGKRVLATLFAETYRGNPRFAANPRDSGGTLEFEWQTTHRVVHLNIGDICLLDYPQLAISNQLVRIQAIQPSANFEFCRITAHWHEDAWYDDTYGQTADPAFSGRHRDRLPRPPFGWLPGLEQPKEGDPIWDTSEWTFGLAQEYETLADGSSLAKAIVTGYLPVNSFSTKTRPPFVLRNGFVGGSGNLPSGATYYFALVARDDTGLLTTPSTIAQVGVPTGLGNISARLQDMAWDATTGAWTLFGGVDPARLSLQGSSDALGTLVPSAPAERPEAIAIPGPLQLAVRGMPDVEFDRMQIRVKRVIHSGVWGAEIAAVTASTLKISGADFNTNEWAGRIVTIIGIKDSAVSMPVANFKVLSNNIDTLTLDPASPDPIADFTPSIKAGDVAVMRFKATTVTETTIGDTLFLNSLNPLVGPKLIIDSVANTTPVRVKTTTAHGLIIGNKVYVSGVLGTTTANGYRYVQVIDADEIDLYADAALNVPIFGNGAYTGGGSVQKQGQGLIPNDENGSIIRFLAGSARGTTAKIKSHTATVYTIEGGWQVRPDATSIWIVEEPTWTVGYEGTSIDNEDPLAVGEMVALADNLDRQTILVQAVALDGGGHESFDHHCPLREMFLLGAPGDADAPYKVTLIFGANGPIATGDSTNLYPVDPPQITIKRGYLQPTTVLDSAAQFDVLWNGTSIFAAGKQPTILAGSAVQIKIEPADFASNPLIALEGDTLQGKVLDGRSAGEKITLVLRFSAP